MGTPSEPPTGSVEGQGSTRRSVSLFLSWKSSSGSHGKFERPQVLRCPVGVRPTGGFPVIQGGGRKSGFHRGWSSTGRTRTSNDPSTRRNRLRTLRTDRSPFPVTGFRVPPRVSPSKKLSRNTPRSSAGLCSQMKLRVPSVC